MKRRSLLLPAALAGTALVAAGLSRRRRHPPSPAGALAYNATGVVPRTYALGAFTVAWEEPGRLVVRHRAEPQRELWATVPGKSFVAAARAAGNARAFRQEGGFFFVEDRRLRTCANQFVDSLAASDDAVTVTGRLQGQWAEVRYSLAFTALSERQLGFTLTLADTAFNRAYLTVASNAQEHFFGFGEQFSHFDLKGKRVPVLVSEKGVGRGAQPLTAMANRRAKAGGTPFTSYAPAPFYLTSQRRALCLENTEYAVFDLRQAGQVQVEVWGAPLKGRVFYGATPAELVQAYTEYAGRMRQLPDWILEGAVAGLQGGTARVRELVAKLQAHDTPLAAVWLQDWVGRRETPSAQRLWWNWVLDREHYPGWEALVADLRQAGVRVLTYINPSLAVDAGGRPGQVRDLFHEAEAHGYLVKRQNGHTYRVSQRDFEAGLVDLTNPAARDWFKQVLKNEVLGAGASGWMADFGEYLPMDAQLASGEAAVAYHNRYPEEWARLNREVVEESGQGGEAVFFCRSGYLHSPSQAALFWLGDQLVTWDAHDGIKTAVIGLLSSGLSGFSLNHSDIGGYTTLTHPLGRYHRSKELLLRWMDLNAFTTVFRSHEGSQPAHNVQVYSDEETLAHFSRMAKVYRALAFYRRELVREAAQTGLPVVRPPFLHYPDDPQVYRLSYQQFMLGREFMVAPVLDPGVTQVSAYLPAGRWLHLWSGQTYGDTNMAGGYVTVPAPLGQPGVFYPESSAVAAQFIENLKAAGIL